MSEQPFSAPVTGGDVAGAVWNAGAPGIPVLGLHGITANHRSFRGLGEALDRHLLALDQRGRGASRDLPEPYAFAQLADDAARALDAAGMDEVIVAGHSMGGFVATRLAQRHPDRVRGLVLIDGGVPLRPPPPGVTVSPEEALGPAVARLQMTFDSRDAYREFWRQHPAVGPYWSDLFEDYVDHDLREIDGQLRSSTRPEAMSASFLELGAAPDYADAVLDLESRGVPRTLLTAPRGLFDEVPPLYDDEWLAEWRRRLPGQRVVQVADVNHYTILIGGGIVAVADAITTMAGELS